MTGAGRCGYSMMLLACLVAHAGVSIRWDSLARLLLSSMGACESCSRGEGYGC